VSLPTWAKIDLAGWVGADRGWQHGEHAAHLIDVDRRTEPPAFADRLGLDREISQWRCSCGDAGYTTTTMADHLCGLVDAGVPVLVTPTTEAA
jgi:hypothetical protein